MLERPATGLRRGQGGPVRSERSPFRLSDAYLRLASEPHTAERLSRARPWSWARVWRSLCRLGQSLARRSHAAESGRCRGRMGRANPDHWRARRVSRWQRLRQLVGRRYLAWLARARSFPLTRGLPGCPDIGQGLSLPPSRRFPQTVERFSSDWGSSSLPPPPHSRTQAEQADLSVTVPDADVGRASCRR